VKNPSLRCCCRQNSWATCIGCEKMLTVTLLLIKFRTKWVGDTDHYFLVIQRRTIIGSILNRICDFYCIISVAFVYNFFSTVCTVVQDCCKGSSNKYRKWHFRGSCSPQTPSRINMKFGTDDYVRDTTRHSKWHVSRIRGVTPTNWLNVNGMCFLVYVLSFL